MPIAAMLYIKGILYPIIERIVAYLNDKAPLWIQSVDTANALHPKAFRTIGPPLDLMK
jgi:hypothetical protein